MTYLIAGIIIMAISAKPLRNLDRHGIIYFQLYVKQKVLAAIRKNLLIEGGNL